MAQTLFDFIGDVRYRLMLDMSRERQEEQDEQELRQRFEAADRAALFAVCREHELDGVVGQRALDLGLSLGDDWQAAYEKERRRLEFLKEKSREICAVMQAAGIPMVVLKNGGIMQGMMGHAVQCPMEDIDSLVRKQDFHRAHELLLQNGFTFKFRSEYEAEQLDEAYRDGATEYYIVTPDGDTMWFELAWRAVAGRWIRPDLEPDTDGFIDRSRCADGTAVHILSPEDNLLQVCIHTAKHSYVRAPGLRLHLDVDRIVSHTAIDWDVFLDKVRAAHVKTSTYLSLYIPTVLFGTPVPTEVLDALRPKQEKRLLAQLAKAGLPHPAGCKFTKLEFLAFQTSLYDSKADVLRVIYPSTAWMNERYGCRNGRQRAAATVARALDLVGIRKKK